MGFRYSDLSVHVLVMSPDRGTGCGPCTPSPAPGKAPGDPRCEGQSKKLPGNQPPPPCQGGSQKPKKRPPKKALDLLRQQLRSELRTSG